MKRLLLLILAGATAAPAAAQEGHHHAARPAPAEEKPNAAHSGHELHTMPAADAPEHGDHHAEPAPSVSADPHAGHDVSGTEGPKPGPVPAEALEGPLHAADEVWGAAAMSRSRALLRRDHGGTAAYRLLMERAEARFSRGSDAYLIDVEAWYGSDVDRLLLTGELEGEWAHGVESAELQALWSHAIGPWFDFQAGARLDLQAGPDRGQLAVGVEGLAPYWVTVKASLYLSSRGELTARIEAEHDIRVTQRLIAQPRLEADFSASDIGDRQLGAGLSTASAAMRLRYQLSPRLAPYVGMEFERGFGRTRDLRRGDGDRPGSVTALAGIRFWL